MARSYDRRRRESMYEDIDAYARRAVDAEIADRDRRPAPPPRRPSRVYALFWGMAITALAGLLLLIGLSLSPLTAPAPVTAATTQPAVAQPRRSAAPGFTSDTQPAPAVNVAADAAPPVSANPEPAHEPDVVLGHPELVGESAPPPADAPVEAPPVAEQPAAPAPEAQPAPVNLADAYATPEPIAPVDRAIDAARAANGDPCAGDHPNMLCVKPTAIDLGSLYHQGGQP